MTRKELHRQMRRLMRSMDFASEHPAVAKRPKSREAKQLVEVYQQLGLVWEFLALQCRHPAGFKTTRDGRRCCSICGTIEGVRESWKLVPLESKSPKSALEPRRRTQSTSS